MREETLKWKEYFALDLVFQFPSGFTKREMSNIAKFQYSNEHTMCSDLMCPLRDCRVEVESGSPHLAYMLSKHNRLKSW